MTDDLHDLFAAAAAQNAAIVPSDALLARVLADAVRVQQRPDVQGASALAHGSWWSGLAALFGGGGGGGGGVLAGLATAAVAGLYLGFAQPPALLLLTDAMTGSGSLDSVDLMPGVDALLSED